MNRPEEILIELRNDIDSGMRISDAVGCTEVSRYLFNVGCWIGSAINAAKINGDELAMYKIERSRCMAKMVINGNQNNLNRVV